MRRYAGADPPVGVERLHLPLRTPLDGAGLFWAPLADAKGGL